jgi:hypothetical protein
MNFAQAPRRRTPVLCHLVTPRPGAGLSVGGFEIWLVSLSNCSATGRSPRRRTHVLCRVVTFPPQAHPAPRTSGTSVRDVLCPHVTRSLNPGLSPLPVSVRTDWNETPIIEALRRKCAQSTSFHFQPMPRFSRNHYSPHWPFIAPKLVDFIRRFS